MQHNLSYNKEKNIIPFHIVTVYIKKFVTILQATT